MTDDGSYAKKDWLLPVWKKLSNREKIDLAVTIGPPL